MSLQCCVPYTCLVQVFAYYIDCFYTVFYIVYCALIFCLTTLFGRSQVGFFVFCIDILSCAGDLLQHFLTVIFNKLDRGETWDDDFELNTILQVQLLDFIKQLICHLLLYTSWFYSTYSPPNICCYLFFKLDKEVASKF